MADYTNKLRLWLVNDEALYTGLKDVVLGIVTEYVEYKADEDDNRNLLGGVYVPADLTNEVAERIENDLTDALENYKMSSWADELLRLALSDVAFDTIADEFITDVVDENKDDLTGLSKR